MKFYDVLPKLLAEPPTRAARSGWNGKGMWIAYTPAGVLRGDARVAPRDGEERVPPPGASSAALGHFSAPVTVLGHMDMRTADGCLLLGWLASQTDLAADDWYILDEPVASASPASEPGAS